MKSFQIVRCATAVHESAVLLNGQWHDFTSPVGRNTATAYWQVFELGILLEALAYAELNA